MDAVCEESSTITQFTPHEIWKQHAVLVVIHNLSTITNISECLGVSLRPANRVRKSWMSSKLVTKVLQQGSLTLIVFIRKKILEFLEKLTMMINNYHSKPVRFITRKMGVSEFLIKQSVHKRQTIFLIQDEKDTNFITGHEGQEERLRCKAF